MHTRLVASLAKRALRTCLGGRVASGPFQGMRYVEASFGSAFGAKLLGTYELELADIIRELSATSFKAIIDLGAAEGYYAVGLARLLRTKVIAFERDSGGRELLEQMSLKNDTACLVQIRGECATPLLRETLACAGQGSTLIVCDIEGGENTLLDAEAVPELKRCHLLVELHDWEVSDIRSTLCGRFAGSHSIQTLSSMPRTPEDFPDTWFKPLVPRGFRTKFMAEHRPPGAEWLWMQPKG